MSCAVTIEVAPLAYMRGRAQPLDHAGQAVQGEVQVDGGVRADEALDRGMADIPLMPERDVLQRRHGEAAHHPRQAAAPTPSLA